uniref:Ricin B lectin domain-containing protein n=1 Tax=Zooxanthella nutricula TaxID=1333877 RepID=A0A7S2N8E5_9DINO
MMAQLGFLNYFCSGQIAIGAWVMGWRMLARANAITATGAAAGVLGMGASSSHKFVTGSEAAEVWWTGNDFTDGFGDHTLLLQHPETLECAMVFEGSGLQDTKDWLANMNFWSTEFCAFGPAHRGFRAKLLRMVGGVDYRQGVHRAARSCSSVTVVGHSLGGAQADLFSACANNFMSKAQEGFIEHRFMRLPRPSPKLGRTYHSDRVPGVFLKNKGNNLCIDVMGTMIMEYRRKVIMYHCELPESPYSFDQRWVVTPDGFIKSRLSGMCLNVNPRGPLMQKPCLSAPSPGQQWEFTPERFLKNKASGECVDGDLKMGKCPYTDQRFELRKDGYLVQKFSGKCVHVKAWGGVRNGSPLVLWPCLQTAGTFQEWELLGNGLLKNKRSGKCAVPQFSEGDLQDPPLVLGPCDTQAAMLFEFLESGFVKDKNTMRCLDVEGQAATSAGSPLTMALCQDKNVIANGLWLQQGDGFIINVGSAHKNMFKCLEIFGEPWHEVQKNTSGAELWLAFCEMNTDQKWQITPQGAIVNVIGSPKCLSFKSNSNRPAADRTLWIDNCKEPSDPTLFLDMKFDRRHDGLIVNRLSQSCIVHKDGDPLAYGSMTEGTLGPDECKFGEAWDHGPNKTITRRADGKCLDVGGPDFAAYPPLTTRECNGAMTQKWARTDGFTRNEGTGMCVGLFKDEYHAEKMGLFLKPCPSNIEQAWDLLPTGQIRHRDSRLCLDAPHKGQAMEFFELTAWDCDDTRPEQRWERILAPKVEAY